MVAAGLAAALASFVPDSSAARAASAGVGEPVDIEIAIDGTGSMASAIARAKHEGARAVAEVSNLLPDTRFGTVVFRDHGNPAGEYELLQPLTSNDQKVQDALNHVTSSGNSSPGNGPAESYNRAFHNAYSDARMGWRPSARKIVVVLGDAEPNGAGTAGLPGCHDRSSDPQGLSTPRELANMRAAGLTLIMIREPSANVTASLQCYASIAAGASPGSQAADAGSDIAGKIVELVQGALAPATLKNDVGLALRNGRTGYTLTVRNPNMVPLTLESLQLVLPNTAFRYVHPSSFAGASSVEPRRTGRTLSWALNAIVAPGKALAVHFQLRTPRRLGLYRTTAFAHVQTASGRELVSTARGVLPVRGRVRSVFVRFSNRGTDGPILTGRIRTWFGGWRGLPAAAAARGSIVLTNDRSRVILRPLRFRLDSLAVPTRAQITLRVVGSTGRGRCSTGAARLVLTARAGAGLDAAVLTMPRACGARTAARTTVTVSAA